VEEERMREIVEYATGGGRPMSDRHDEAAAAKVEFVWTGCIMRRPVARLDDAATRANIAAALREAERRGYRAGQERMKQRCLLECQVGYLAEVAAAIDALPLEDDHA
jgi:hypothetical protein